MKLAAVFFLALFAPCVYSQGWVVHKVADVVDAETAAIPLVASLRDKEVRGREVNGRL